MDQVGYILGTENGRARVEVKRLSGCSGTCKSCSGCDTPSVIVNLENTIGAKIGDIVEIKGQGNTILKYTFLIYMIPFAMLILGLVGGITKFKAMGYANYELYGFLVGIVFLFLSFGILKLIDNKSKARTKDMMRIVKIIN